jgi:Lon protease-like protein
MFPLQSVLFPSAVLPLHVFEPRYRALVREVLDGDRTFGVTLIERGSEVGGGDLRVHTGTRARVVQADALPDGRWVLVAVGTTRLRVLRWLPDDPYPQAEVEELVEPEPGPDAGAWRLEAEAVLRRTLALGAELGDAAAPATVALADDVTTAAFQMGALAPVGPADAQRLLEAATVEERLQALIRVLSEEVEVLEARIAGA